MSEPLDEHEQLKALEALLGEYVSIEYEDGKGGRGLLVEVLMRHRFDEAFGEHRSVWLTVDYGYQFILLPGAVVKKAVRE